MRLSLGSRGNYPYACARVRAKKAALLTKDNYPKLLMMDLNEIGRFLGETQYNGEMTELASRYDGGKLIEEGADLGEGQTLKLGEEAIFVVEDAQAADDLAWVHAFFEHGLGLEHAANVLCSLGSASVTDIAQTCGFSSSQYFATVFARNYGCSPSDFRKRAAGNS